MKTKLKFFPIFLEMLAHPSSTIKTILNNEPGYFVWPIIIFSSLVGGYEPIILENMPSYLPFPIALLIFVLASLILGIIFFQIQCFIVLKLGKWLGGKATYIEVQTACAWAYPPYFVGLLFDFLRQLPYWINIFHGHMELKDFLTVPMADWHHIFGVISFLFGFWVVGLTVINVAEAHKISIWKSVFISPIFWVLGWLVAFIIVMYFARQFQNPHIPQFH